ncbi:AAA family ATPase [Dendryphion nanum]|uniref:AAA family ATPase n=1 Tax=Dendryphion nanum TaxID=256645 RepID=A0A9P9IV14_9PLEO|nr:AAA family ATPase [Dendryphion nanum]
MSLLKRSRECDETTEEGDIAFAAEDVSAKRARQGSLPTSAPNFQRHLVVHRVKCIQNEGKYHSRHLPTADYDDVPYLAAGTNRVSPLEGRRPIVDATTYLEDHAKTPFVVCITYSCNQYHKDIKSTFELRSMPVMDSRIASEARPYFFVLTGDAKPATPESEEITLSDDMGNSLELLRVSHPTEVSAWGANDAFTYPYLALYHYKSLLTGNTAKKLGFHHQQRLNSLSKYLEDKLSAEFKQAEDLFESGRVTREHWMKLFRPHEVLVTVDREQTIACFSESCPTVVNDQLVLNCVFWQFDGTFFKEKKEFRQTWPSESNDVAITDLSIYPLRYGKPDLEEKLRERGKIFWACRFRRYVSYDVPPRGLGGQKSSLRYMIDTATYNLVHSENEVPIHYDLSDEEFQSESSPEDPFLLLLPPTIKGFGFQNKKWTTLTVEHIKPIEWNKDAFKHKLVLDEDKKLLMEAMTKVHMEKRATPRTDFMEGKGDGLIMLLHGSPGTGKTLTAESIAEYAERPLYRVTCGDIGTDAESVEQYLKSVLFIGSTWGCVVLLDEADIFLEERSKMDLQRNALVSVFLRVLEYYNGILILTSNRIGTFDEAFKSRVQLALHYPPLDEKSRLEVWRNFIDSLLKNGEKIDYEEIYEKTRTLATDALNGRQIRNTINTARQLARFKEEILKYEHINKAIRVANEFEKYVRDVHGHEDEAYARAKGDR